MGDCVGDLRHCPLIRVNVSGELRLTQSGQALIQPVHRPLLPPEPEAEPAPVEATQHRGSLGKQCEMSHVVSVVAESPDNLREVKRIDQSHGDDGRPLVFACHQIQDLMDARSPGRQILEIHPQAGRKHPVQAKAEMLRIANDASRKAPMKLKGGRGLASPKGAVDPHQHKDDSTYWPSAAA